MAFETNKYQTQLTDEFLDSLDKEVRDELLGYINDVPFIKRLISPDRKRAKDLPRDEKGRIIVDLCNPHICEDMDYFRQTGIHYQKYGVYTFLRPNKNPNSDFGKWLRREVKRCWEGMVRPSDGEWITGDMYFYLNYFPIIQSKITEGTKQATRVVDFPECWEGVYWRFHYWDQARYGGLYSLPDHMGGQHCGEIARRGASKSYCGGAKLAKIFLLGESITSCRKVKGIVTAYGKEYLTKDGILNKFVDGVQHCADHTQFPSLRLRESTSDMNWIAGYKDTVTGLTRGSENEIIGASSVDNIEVLRGKRCHVLFYEEFGAFPKFLDAWQINVANVQEGEIAFGQAFAWGTGGSEGSDFSGALELIYNPEAYNVYALPNVWDKGATGNKRSLFIFPQYVNAKGYFNKDGVSDVIGALISEIKIRMNIKYHSTDPIQLTRRKAEYGITIQEMIMKREGTMFPVADLTDRLNELDQHPNSFDDIYTGELVINGTDVVYKPNNNKQPIMHYPLPDNKNAEGSIQIYEMPIKDGSGKVPRGRYIAGADTYDDDASETTSLGSIFILDLLTDKIVFEYTGRPMFADDFYEICRRALLFYNATCNYENNKKGLFTYFSRHNSTSLLTDTLESLIDKDMMKGGLYGNKAKGTNSTVPVKALGRRFIRDWLIKPKTVIIAKEDENGEIYEEESKTRNLVSMYQRALIQELTLWNIDGNFDRVDAMVQLMLLRDDKLRIIGDGSIQDSIEDNDSEYAGNDDFFKRHYDKRIIVDIDGEKIQMGI